MSQRADFHKQPNQVFHSLIFHAVFQYFLFNLETQRESNKALASVGNEIFLFEGCKQRAKCFWWWSFWLGSCQMNPLKPSLTQKWWVNGGKEQWKDMLYLCCLKKKGGCQLCLYYSIAAIKLEAIKTSEIKPEKKTEEASLGGKNYSCLAWGFKRCCQYVHSFSSAFLGKPKSPLA